MGNSTVLKSSIIRKAAMALSGLFLILFLAQHCFINSTSLFSPETFNAISHFMGYNPLVQYVIQPILIFGVVFHFVMGIVLKIQNNSARPTGYSSYNGSANASWASRNMIISGAVILAFLGLHFYDFWIPEMDYKYIAQNVPVEDRYYEELLHKFVNPVRVALYLIANVLLGFHLWHGFASSFQSVGFNNKYSKSMYRFTQIFAVFVPFMFCVIAVVHYFNH